MAVNLLFDLDGTLVDPREGILQSMKYAFQQLGRTAPADGTLERAIGPPLHVGLASLLNTSDPGLIRMGVALYRERFSQVGIVGNEPYAGITESLQSLQDSGVRLFVATSKPLVFAAQIIEYHKLKRFFAAVYGSELNGSLSDKSELIGHILSEEGLSAERCRMIGDREHDIIGAVANRVTPIGVLWGFGARQELENAGARHIVQQPKDLVGRRWSS